MSFDPDAPGQPEAGIFGLPHTRDQAAIILIPVPFDATTSYGTGTSRGPRSILQASTQVDLLDRQYGPIYEQGIFIEAENEQIAAASARARSLAEPIIAQSGPTESDAAAVHQINDAGQLVNTFVSGQVAGILAEGKTPGLIGGEHAVSFGAIKTCAEHRGPIGVLQIDAHMDLRRAYEGFEWSHASIMWNVLTHVPQVTRLVQVGVRDYGKGELDFAAQQGHRVRTFYDADWYAQRADGRTILDQCREAIESLPEQVYISFDIDGLDPSLCPNTGTPVPGGLSFNEAALVLKTLADSGRKIVGFDLVEVCPGGLGDWDANVGARMLYKLCGAAGTSTATRS